MFLPHDLYLNLRGLQQHLDAVTVDPEVTTMHLVISLGRE
jgi:hypothetical protein